MMNEQRNKDAQKQGEEMMDGAIVQAQKNVNENEATSDVLRHDQSLQSIDKKEAKQKRKEDKKLAKITKKQEINSTKSKSSTKKKMHFGVNKVKVCLSAFGCILLPYLFILAMGFLDSMQVLHANVNFIISCSFVIGILFLIYTMKLASKGKKQA